MLNLLSKTQDLASQRGVALSAEETQRLSGLVTEFQNRAAVLTQTGSGSQPEPGNTNGGGGTSGSSGTGGSSQPPTNNSGTGSNTQNGGASSSNSGNQGGNGGRN